jgi:hypothetical protein
MQILSKAIHPERKQRSPPEQNGLHKERLLYRSARQILKNLMQLIQLRRLEFNIKSNYLQEYSINLPIN